jgi:cell division septation protein DedD
MYRIFVVAMLIVGLMFAGCSKKEEDIKAIEQEAVEGEAAEVMDSLERAGTEAETYKETAAGAAQTETYSEAAPTDYSGLEGFVVQIGSYADYGFARMMAEKYQSRDYPAFVQTIEIDGKIYYRLRVGVYETLEDAKTIGELLKDRYSAEYWIDMNR